MDTRLQENKPKHASTSLRHQMRPTSLQVQSRPGNGVLHFCWAFSFDVGHLSLPQRGKKQSSDHRAAGALCPLLFNDAQGQKLMPNGASNAQDPNSCSSARQVALGGKCFRQACCMHDKGQVTAATDVSMATHAYTSAARTCRTRQSTGPCPQTYHRHMQLHPAALLY